VTISSFLQSLRASGDGSFEDLIGALLGALTGLRFYAARSGDQGGSDGRTSGSAGGDIVFECKCYSAKTPLRDRELMGELAQAHLSLPELAVWIIAASLKVTDQNLKGLQAFGKEHGIDIVPLESLPDGNGTLDFLVGASGICTIAVFGKPRWKSWEERPIVVHRGTLLSSHSCLCRRCMPPGSGRGCSNSLCSTG
jgi:hypothetical protein